jgi:tetratricopeptide (TPR) repeat protein
MPAAAASSSDFYLTMLRKGISAYDAGRFDAAAPPLRVAAFGLVDSIEHYQTAHIYLALTLDRLGNAEQTRESARRVVTGERIASKYASLQLPPATRSNFEALARRVLTPADVAILGRAAQGTIAPQTQAVAPPQTQPQTPQPQASSSQAVAPPPVPVKVESAPVKAEVVKPEPKKQDPPKVQTPTPAVTRPAPTTTTNSSRPAQPAPINVPARLAAAEKALTDARLVDARNIYRELLDKAILQRADLLRVAEGFYRARDFAHALRAFDRMGGLQRGEEPYRYYIAVALYETAQYSRAKQELDAVLPFIEQTPDVARYRVKIENAIN